jgi:hypothetical protein
MGVPQTETNTDATIGAPAIIMRRNLSDVINSGDLRPGQKLPGKDYILVTVREPTDRSGESLGRNLAFFGASENLPGEPQCFNRNVETIVDLRDWHGHNGWKFDWRRYEKSYHGASYEDGLFKGYRDGSAIDTWGIPELLLLNGNDRYGKPVNPDQNMLLLSRDEKSAFYNTFVTSGSPNAGWSQSCTADYVNLYCVGAVHFPDGKTFLNRIYHVNYRSCVRPVVALELKHLVL